MAATTTLLVLAIAVVAGLVASPDGGAPVIFVNRISSAIGEVTTGAGSGLWWSYAFLLGGVAAFNPCGFALLPAYLGLYLSADSSGSSFSARARRSLTVAGVVALAFTAMFGAMGAVFSIGSSAIVRSLPWAGLAVGFLLILVGGMTLAGRPIGQRLPHRLADRLGKGAGENGTRGYAAFGLAYGVASLGCTLPLFLGLMGTATAAAGRWAAVLAFALYGAGMAAVLGVLTIAAGMVSFGALTRVRSMTRFVSGMGAALLLISGAYVTYYWLSAGRLLLA
jgi:cytochrome c biogenesis protein CcdA